MTETLMRIPATQILPGDRFVDADPYRDEGGEMIWSATGSPVAAIASARVRGCGVSVLFRIGRIDYPAPAMEWIVRAVAPGDEVDDGY